MPIRPKQSVKQAFGIAAGGSLRSARPYLIVGGLVWAVASVAFNGFGSKANSYAEYGTYSRSEQAYLDKRGAQVSSFSISMRDITDVSNDHNGIYLTNAAYEKFKRARGEYASLTTPWTGKIGPIIEQVGGKGNNGFTWTFNGFSFSFAREGAQLMQIADRYNVALMPSDDGALPQMTITKKEGRYSTAITLPDTMSQADNAETLRLLLAFIKNNDRLKPDMSGVYKVERRQDSGALYLPAAEPPVQASAPPAAAIPANAQTDTAQPGDDAKIAQLRREVESLRRQVQALGGTHAPVPAAKP
jgi:hypothetical protein